jgi:hypothetical protein
MTNRFGDIDTSFKRLPPLYGYRSEKIVSLEKALEPIESEIDELPYYVKIAKNHCHYPSEHGLSKDQSAAVYIYTMEWGETTLYRVLNKALRSENRQAVKIWFPYLKLFDTALDRLPTVKEVLWRGVPLNIGKKFTQNQMLTWWSISSCSSVVNVIKNFLENESNSTLFLIEAVNGKKVSGYTEYENEDEVILRMGTRFRVKCDALAQSNGSHIVHLIEIDNTAGDQSMIEAGTEVTQTTTSLNQGASSKSSSTMSKDVEKKPTPAATNVQAYPNEKVDDKKKLQSIISKIINILELDISNKKDEILKNLLENGQQALKNYKDYLIPDVYTEVMNGNDNQLMKYLKNYFEQQWKIEYNSNQWFIQFLNESKSNDNRHLYEQVLIRTAKYGNKFMKKCPILSISLQILFEGIDDKCLEKTNIFDELWFTITSDGLKSIRKYSEYIFQDVMNEQINNKQSILFQALRQYYRQELFQLFEQCNIRDRQNLYETALDHVAELGWKNGLKAIENRVIPINFKSLLEKVDAYLKQQQDTMPKQSNFYLILFENEKMIKNKFISFPIVLVQVHFV